MSSEHGLWIGIEEGIADKVGQEISDQDRFTDVVSASAIHPRPAELVVVSLDKESIDYIGISRGGNRIATDKKRVAISRLTYVGLTLAEVREKLPKKFQKQLDFATIGARRISPVFWQKILGAIVSLKREAAKSLHTLRSLVIEIESGKVRREGGLEVFERDAVASSLQIFGGEKFRKQILRSASPYETKGPASFLSGLSNVALREDPQIINDSTTFPGLEVARKYIVGAVELENPNGERLTIINCNRQPLEQTLGVDLIYYNHQYDSFVLVQYKRMTGTGENVCYRPQSDKNYESELLRMADMQRKLTEDFDATPSEHASYRLSTLPFFFKLCEQKAKTALDEGMVSGMYIPLAFWQLYFGSDDSKGPRGGQSIGWKSCPRHFNNGDFTKLLRAGWIGSTGGQSKYLSEIIREIIDSKHMLVYAATGAATDSTDYLRDSQGQFASEDDPLASR